MAAETIKKNQITKPKNKKTNQPTIKQQKILQIKSEHPDLTVRQIAVLADAGHPHVVQTLQRYGINQTHLDDYKTHRADILAGLQHRLLTSVTDEDIKKTPLGSRVLAAAQLIDKERLERGQTTTNIGALIAHIEGFQRSDISCAVQQSGNNTNNQDNIIDVL
ncbi:MAG: hypothetical protein WC364_12320 [Eubacteriales bacterium]|jgi:hypothetical protein